MRSKKVENPGRKPNALERAAGECAADLFMEDVNAAIDSVPPGALKDVNLDRWFWQTLANNTEQPKRARRPLPKRAMGIAACVATMVLVSVTLWQTALKPRQDRLIVELTPGETVEKQLLPNVMMKATIDAPEIESVPAEVSIEAIVPDVEAMKALFMPGQEPVKVMDGANGAKYGYGLNDYALTYQNGTRLDANTYGLIFYTHFMGEDIAALSSMIDALYNGAHYAGPNYADTEYDDGSYLRALDLDSLPFMSRDQADRMARERLRALGGAADVRLCRVYTLDRERLQFFTDLRANQNSDFVSSGTPDWTDEDACYVLEYEQVPYDLPLESDEHQRGDPIKPEYHLQTNRARVVISARGFEYVSMWGLFRVLSAEAPAPLLSADAALDLFVKKLQADPPEKELLVTKMQLHYVKISEYQGATQAKLVPMWRFLTPDEHMFSSFSGDSWTSFNAITGKEDN